ncbi:MAG: response regulator [Candidatus Synoicihabitans palmerolidicus]|nr:response regulator [Candidatus Synoicihabitans palmerolidicus]
MVFLIEDDDAVRSFTRRTLIAREFRVIEATSGPDALALWPQHAHEIDVVLTDLVMPGGLTGFDVASRLREDKLGLCIVFTSGYSTELAELNHVHQPCNFLPKPYTSAKLLAALNCDNSFSSE